MTEFRTRAFVGLLSLGLLSTIGCKSSSDTSGSGGSNGSGGSSAKGGSNGSGGSGSGSGGSNGSGGSTSGSGGSSTTGCMAAPSNGLIADFMGNDGGIEIVGGLASFGGNAQPLHTVGDGFLNVTENNGSGSSIQYVGQVIYFNNCVDASAFTGIEFMLGGSLSGCPLVYATNDALHDDMGTDPTKGKCDAGSSCYSPQATISSVQSDPTMIQEPWITSPGGDPDVAFDPHQVTGIQWQFAIPIATDGGANVCMANLNISQVQFYQ